ncbi:MAG TPA: hypothetical protein VOA78_11970 [Candidatus Dormibacteraeota bacterium]|nr:hypothetical protein [Candidatus Dormibacteraeota bacterium]
MRHVLALLARGRLTGKCVLSSLLALLLFTPAIPTRAQDRNPDKDASRSPGWVVLPVDEYRSLRAKAFPPDHEPEPPPVDAMLTRVDYDLRVTGDFASGRASLTIDVLKDGWVRVPIPSGLLVREARLDGKAVSLVSNISGKAGSLTAVLYHPGRAVLTLDIALPIAANAGEESFALPSSSSGVTRAAVEIPRNGVDIRLTGGLLSDHTESAASSKWTVYARGNEPLTFTWHRKIEDHRMEQPLRLRGSLTQWLGLGEDSTAVTAEVALEVVQGGAREARIQVPPQITINQVQGATVADWEMKSGELAVIFLEPIEQSARFVINGEVRLPRDGQVDIPILRLLNTERDTGGIAVDVLGAGEITNQKPQGLESADASDLGELVTSRQSPSMIAFRFRAGDSSSARALSVNVARYDQQAVLMANVEEARYRVLISKEGKTLVQARYAVRNNQRNFVKVTLPPGGVLWSASLGGKPIRPGQAQDGSLLLPLEKSRSGEEAPEFAVEIVYFLPGAAWNDKGKAKLMLPALDLPVSRTGLQVYYPPLFRVNAESGGAFRTETYVDPTSPVLNARDELFDSEGGRYQAGVGIGGGAGAALGGVASVSAPAPPPAKPDFGARDDKDAAGQAATNALLDKYRTATHVGRATGVLPIHVSFPAFGPSVYLVSELTSENQAPSTDLNYQPDKKGGSR